MEPRCNAWGYTSEVFIVSFLPQTPGSSEECFNEERIGPGGLCGLQRIKPILKVNPMNTYLGPTPFAELAGEDHMLESLISILPTKETCEVIPDVIVSSSQHVTCVQPVVQQQPSKYFDFHRTV